MHAASSQIVILSTSPARPSPPGRAACREPSPPNDRQHHSARSRNPRQSPLIAPEPITMASDIYDARPAGMILRAPSAPRGRSVRSRQARRCINIRPGWPHALPWSAPQLHRVLLRTARRAVVRIALRTVAGDVLRARSACPRSAPRGHAPRRYVRAYGDAHRPPIAQTESSSRGTSGRRDTGWVSSPSKPRVRNARKQHLCDCRPGWEAKARPRARSSTHSSQRLVGATCQPLRWSRSSAENSSPRARPPDYDESSARRDHQASAAVIALSASRMSPPTSPAVAAQCKGTRARAPGSQRRSSRVSGSGAVPS
jgi:hypothetical protein